MSDLNPESVGLPLRPFFYTLPQICDLLQLSPESLRRLTYYEGRTVVIRNPHHLWAVNIALPDDTPEWRVLEEELIRWLRLKRIEVTETRKVRGRPSARESFRRR